MTYKDMNGTKNFSLNKKNGMLLKFFAGVIALFLFISLLNLFGAKIKNYFYLASNPIEKIFWIAGQATSKFFNSILKAGSLAEENEGLRYENQKLLSQITFLQAVQNANEAQNEASLIYQNSGFELVMAGVIGFTDQDELTIDKGLDSGIFEGMPVVNQQNALFGKVSRAYKNFSKIMLISNKESIINVKVLATEIYGVIKGDGGLGAHLDLVPIDDTLKEGDILITSALEGTFPKDLLIGKINRVDKNDQNPHQQAQVQLFLDVKTDNLFVISNYKR